MRRSRYPAVLNVATTIVLFAGDARAQITREAALASAYPGAEVRAERIFLTKSQIESIRTASGVTAPPGLVARYVAMHDGRSIGRAYVDTHTVRTKNESLLVLLDDNGRVKRIEVTAFLEPPEYQASRAWYDQYNGKGLTEDLRLNRAIRPIAGASLTARATAEAVRRVLAIDRELNRGRGVQP